MKTERERRKRITAGVEERDRAIGRTLGQSQCRFGRNPVRCAAVDGLLVGLAVVEPCLGRPCHRARPIRLLAAMYNPSMLSLVRRSLICYRWSFRTSSCQLDPFRVLERSCVQMRCHAP